LRQAAYRKRYKLATEKQLRAKGLPALPPISTLPGWSRWKQAIAHVEDLITDVKYEMEAYYEDRSEQWKEDGRGDEFQDKLRNVMAVADALGDCLF
jgi:hypothetical protein